MMRGLSLFRLGVPFIVASAAVWSVASPSASQETFALRVLPLDSPASANSAQPQLSVSSRGALLSWIERDAARASLKFSELRAGRWTPAREVASGADWFVNWADVPSVIRLADGKLVAHWLQKSGPGTYAYDVRLSHSSDDGRTWSKSFLPHSDGTRSEHGFASLFQMPGAGLGLVWLDGRAMQSGHDTSSGGAMTVRYGAFDKSFRQLAETAVDLRVCECCPTAAAVTSDGPIVAYRNRTEQEIRDIYVSRLEGGKWSEPQPVANDNWNITGCPVNGPAISALGRSVVVAWFTGAGQQNRAFVAFSKDSGRTFAAPIRLDDASTLGRVDVELSADGSALATWIEYASRVAEFRVRRITASGDRSPSVTISKMTSDRSSGYPRLVRRDSEIVFAWVESFPASPPASGTQLRVRTAVARLPQLGKSPASK